jgi:hypothetical protein
MYLSQNSHGQNALHVAVKQEVLWNILDQQAEQSTGTHARMFRVIGNLSKETKVAPSQYARHANDGTRPKEILFEKVSLVLHFNNGFDIESFPRN